MLSEKIRNIFVEERTRIKGYYRVQDGSVFSEDTPSGQLCAAIPDNEHNRVAEAEIVERRTRLIGNWEEVGMVGLTPLIEMSPNQEHELIEAMHHE